MPDARWNDPREYDDLDRGDGRPRVYGERDRDDRDSRDSLIHDLDLPRGEERELVVDRDRVYELNGEDSRTLAAVGTFRVVPEQDLDTGHDTVRHLLDEGLVETVDVGGEERGLTLTKQGRDLLDSHRLERDSGAAQSFHAGVGRPREIDHDANLYATFCQESAATGSFTPALVVSLVVVMNAQHVPDERAARVHTTVCKIAGTKQFVIRSQAGPARVAIFPGRTSHAAGRVSRLTPSRL